MVLKQDFYEVRVQHKKHKSKKSKLIVFCKDKTQARKEYKRQVGSHPDSKNWKIVGVVRMGNLK